MPVQTITVTGSITNASPTPTSTNQTYSGNAALNVSQQVSAIKPNVRAIASPASFEDMLAGSGVTTATFIYLRVFSGSLVIRTTTAAGTDQLQTVSGMYLWSSPNSGDGATAVAIQGTADYEILLGGN